MEDADNTEFDEFPDDTESDYTADDTEYEEAAVDAEETAGVSVATRERSLVYTATQDTLFQKIPNDTRTHSLVSNFERGKRRVLWLSTCPTLKTSIVFSP